MIDKLSKIIMLIIITYSLSGQEGTTYEAGKLLIKVSTPFSYIDNSGAVTTTEKQWFNTLATYYEIHKLKPIFSNSEGDMDLYYYIEFDYLYTVNQVKYSFFNEQEILSAWVNHIGEAFGEDQLYDQQWALENIQAFDGWQIGSGQFNVVIAIVDFGIDLGVNPIDPQSHHEDLRNHLWNGNGLYGINIDDDTAYPNSHDGDTHGTMTAGVAAAATWNDIGIAGLAGGGFNNEAGLLIMAVKISSFRRENEISSSIHS